MNAIAVVSRVVTYETTAIVWLFIVMYHLLSRGAWRHDQMGRHLMALAGVDAGIFTMLTVTSFWPLLAIQTWYQWTYLCVVAGISVVTAWRAVILWRLYRARPKPAPSRPRWRITHPFLAWQAGLAGAQVINGDLIGSRHLALLVGVAQVAMACFAYGRSRAVTSASTTTEGIA